MLATREPVRGLSTKDALCLLYVLADLSPKFIDYGLDGLPDVADFLRPVLPRDAPFY